MCGEKDCGGEPGTTKDDVCAHIKQMMLAKQLGDYTWDGVGEDTGVQKLAKLVR